MGGSRSTRVGAERSTSGSASGAGAATAMAAKMEAKTIFENCILAEVVFISKRWVMTWWCRTVLIKTLKCFVSDVAYEKTETVMADGDFIINSQSF